MDTLYTFWDNITHYKTESVHFLVLMNSATEIPRAQAVGDVAGLQDACEEAETVARRNAKNSKKERYDIELYHYLLCLSSEAVLRDCT